MAMRRASLAAAAAVKGAAPGDRLRALLYSTSSFPFSQPQTPTEKPPPAEPSVNLFVSGVFFLSLYPQKARYFCMIF